MLTDRLKPLWTGLYIPEVFRPRGWCIRQRELWSGDVLKGTVRDSGESLLMFELDRKSNYTLPFRAPEAMC